MLDLTTHRLRRLHEFADEASSDGRFSLGEHGGDENAVSIIRVADRQRVFQRKGACCPDWNR